MRKAITLVTELCETCNLPGWRQSSYNIKAIKRKYRKAQQTKRSTSKNLEKQKERKQLIIDAHKEYIEYSAEFIEKIRESIKLSEAFRNDNPAVLPIIAEIRMFLGFADLLRDQIYRRVVNGETIPHDEKVFSLFQEFTEWISKGKADVPVELGLKVCIVEDQYGFILNHRVMQNQTDDQVAVSLIKQTVDEFPSLSRCSFDKGFHSPVNQEELKKQLETVVLPRKGRLSQADKDREYSEEFIEARHQHSAVESAINALEVHGLDRCPDHGIHGFERYISLAILARNIQQIGVEIKQRQLAIDKKEKLLKLVA